MKKRLSKKIGYEFKDQALLKLALTHPSSCHENSLPQVSNQRLEFLGDAVLALVSSTMLYRENPDLQEGDLSEKRSRITCDTSLARIGRSIGVGEFLFLGQGEEASGGRNAESNIADCVEALLGAAYLDGGLSAAESIFGKIVQPHIAELSEREFNPKGHLQEIIQAREKVVPRYEIQRKEGPDHAPEFSARVLSGKCELGVGEGASKQKAAKNAAADALSRISKG